LCKSQSGVNFLRVRGVIFVAFVHVVNIEKFYFLNIIVNGQRAKQTFYLIEILGG
jgi:DNA helicase TIP49 (TBP-interacting protein)